MSDSNGKSIVLRLAAKTDVGRVRGHNEDNFIVADLGKKERGVDVFKADVKLDTAGSLIAVCDGMGGAAAGEVASQLAVDTLFQQMTDTAAVLSFDRDELARRLVRSVENAGLQIFQQANSDRSRKGMGTTVTAASLLDDTLFLAQVGDSRGYLLRGDKLVQVTRDQSLVNQLIEAGQLTEEEAESFEHNNIILQALGNTDSVQVDLTYVDLRRGDVLLLCSDGLSGMVHNDDIRETLLKNPDPAEACRVLVDKANEAGGHDNVTAIVVTFLGEGLKERTDGEALKYSKYNLPEEDNLATKRVSLRAEPEDTGSSSSISILEVAPLSPRHRPASAQSPRRSRGWRR